MLKVGLTGGIGAGKSEVARRLARYGALIIDADRIAREVVEPGTEGLAQVVGVFGPGVLAGDGTLDRQRLGEMVFTDPELRAKLNGIIHPLVGARLRQLEEAADPGAIVVEDIPLIAENDLAGFVRSGRGGGRRAAHPAGPADPGAWPDPGAGGGPDGRPGDPGAAAGHRGHRAG